MSRSFTLDQQAAWMRNQLAQRKRVSARMASKRRDLPADANVRVKADGHVQIAEAILKTLEAAKQQGILV